MNLEDLGRRAVACKHWRWMPGMLARMSDRSLRCDVIDLGLPAKSGVITIGRMAVEEWEYLIGTEPTIPDLSDPATLGCLLYLVRKAWGDADLSADRVSRAHDKLPDVWQVYVFHESGVKDVLSGHSEVEALVAALEAAP